VVSAGLTNQTDVAVLARLGYDDHRIAFDLPTVLRGNAPDLSLSSLEVDPVSSPPQRPLSYTLTVRNTGVSAALAIMTTTIPYYTTFVGRLDTGGIGTWQVVSDVLSWTGSVAAGSEVVLGYQLELNEVGNYMLRHVTHLSDQYGERWNPEASASIWTWRTFFPMMHK
jgi:hypothetical protein